MSLSRSLSRIPPLSDDYSHIVEERKEKVWTDWRYYDRYGWVVNGCDDNFRKQPRFKFHLSSGAAALHILKWRLKDSKGKGGPPQIKLEPHTSLPHWKISSKNNTSIHQYPLNMGNCPSYRNSHFPDASQWKSLGKILHHGEGRGKGQFSSITMLSSLQGVKVLLNKLLAPQSCSFSWGHNRNFESNSIKMIKYKSFGMCEIFQQTGLVFVR